MKDKIVIGLFLICLFLLESCRTFYAVVDVDVKDIDSNTSIGLDAYSGKDGLWLGFTQIQNKILLKKKKKQRNPTLSIIIKDDTQCYPTSWGIYEISKWAPHKVDAYNALYKNIIQIKIKKNKDCSK